MEVLRAWELGAFTHTSTLQLDLLVPIFGLSRTRCHSMLAGARADQGSGQQLSFVCLWSVSGLPPVLRRLPVNGVRL